MSFEWRTQQDGERLVLEALAGLGSSELTHVAVGTGTQASPPSNAQAGLIAEIGRARLIEKYFVVETLGGPVVVDGRTYLRSDAVTSLLFMRFRFEADEAAGNWSEMGVFGGDVAYTPRGAVLVDGGQAGDDRAGRDVVLGGSYDPAVSQTLTVTVSTAGGSGVAEVGWVSNGPEAPGSSVVTFDTPVILGTTGLSLVFTGGADGVLTLGDAWELQATVQADSPVFASGGVYHPTTNPDGQVLVSGRVFAIARVNPAMTKGATAEDVRLVVEVLVNG